MKVDATERQTSFDSFFSVNRFLLTLGLLIFVTYPGPLLGTRTFCYRDAGLFSYPVAYYLRDSFWQGKWPLWNPYICCGTPFLAQWNTLALYPLSLFYILLPMPWSMNVFLLGHLVLGGVGMYKLAHHWFGTRFGASVAGLVFAWNGLTIHCLMWPCQTAGLAWMPWVIWLGVRAIKEGGCPIYWAALAGACQMLTGSPETTLFTWLIVAGAFVCDHLQRNAGRAFSLSAAPVEERVRGEEVSHKGALHPGPLPAGRGEGETTKPDSRSSPHGFLQGSSRLLWLVVLVTALGAIQLLPCCDLLVHGDRTSATGNAYWSLPPWGLANFFVPLFHSSASLSGVFMQDEQQWTSSYYIGILPLALAAVAVCRARGGPIRLLLGLALAGMLLAFADAGLALNILKRGLPFLGFIRYPVKFIILTVFCLSALAGAGAAWLQTRPPPVVRRNLFVPGICIVVVILLLMAAAYWFPFPSDAWSDLWPNALGRLAFLLVPLVLLVFKTEGPRFRALLSFAFLVWMGLDICTHEPQQNPTVPTQAYDAYAPPMERVPQLGQSRAMLSPVAERTMDNLVNPDLLKLYLGQRAELFSDCNLLDRIPKVSGFMTLHLAEENKVAGLLQSGRAAPGLAEFLGVSQVASASQLFHWEAQTNFMAWASLGQRPIFLDDDATLSALCDKRFSPRQIVYLPSGARGQITAGADTHARLLSSHIEPSECVFTTSAESRTMLVMAQAWYHGWQATVDGAPVPLFRANYAFQAVEIPPGQHEVRLKYVDRAFQPGVFISVSALITCLVLVGRSLGR